MDLTEFLLARITEDEYQARLALPVWGDDAWAAMQPETIWLAARIDPARVLCECKAKRRIVERCDKMLGLWCDQTGDDAGWGTLRVLAAVYADHPDCRDEWRP